MIKEFLRNLILVLFLALVVFFAYAVWEYAGSGSAFSWGLLVRQLAAWGVRFGLFLALVILFRTALLTEPGGSNRSPFSLFVALLLGLVLLGSLAWLVHSRAGELASVPRELEQLQQQAALNRIQPERVLLGPGMRLKTGPRSAKGLAATLGWVDNKGGRTVCSGTLLSVAQQRLQLQGGWLAADPPRPFPGAVLNPPVGGVGPPHVLQVGDEALVPLIRQFLAWPVFSPPAFSATERWIEAALFLTGLALMALGCGFLCNRSPAPLPQRVLGHVVLLVAVISPAYLIHFGWLKLLQVKDVPAQLALFSRGGLFFLVGVILYAVGANRLAARRASSAPSHTETIA